MPLSHFQREMGRKWPKNPEESGKILKNSQESWRILKNPEESWWIPRGNVAGAIKNPWIMWKMLWMIPCRIDSGRIAGFWEESGGMLDACERDAPQINNRNEGSIRAVVLELASAASIWILGRRWRRHRRRLTECISGMQMSKSTCVAWKSPQLLSRHLIRL